MRALESVVNQSVPCDQVIYIDDGSADDSFQIARQFLADRLPQATVIHHERPVGLCRSLNEALALSTGTYIQTLAADDYWLPHKTEVQLRAMPASADVVAVYSDALLIDISGERQPGSFMSRYAPEGVPEGTDLFRRLLTRGNFLPGMAMLLRREVIVQEGGWDERLFYEDWDMWLRLSSRWRFQFVDDIVAAYRFVPTSMTNAQSREIWLSDFDVVGKWVGRSLGSDFWILRRALVSSVRAARRRDFRHLRRWLALALHVLLRRPQRPVTPAAGPSRSRQQ